MMIRFHVIVPFKITDIDFGDGLLYQVEYLRKKGVDLHIHYGNCVDFEAIVADGGQYALIGHGSSGSDLIFAKSCSDCVCIEKTKVVVSLESRGLKCVIDMRCGAPISEGGLAVTSNANIAVEQILKHLGLESFVWDSGGKLDLESFLRRGKSTR